MKVSTKGRYAIRVMLDLAMNDTGDYIPLKDISARQDITIKYMEQIIAILNRAGYLHSVRGTGGGYKLARAPKEYTLGEILRTTEGSLAPVSCLDGSTNECERAGICPTLSFWTGLDKVIQEYVDSVTLADLMEHAKEMVPMDFNI